MNTTATGFLLTGNNHSDGLNMLLKHSLTGLRPSAPYGVTFEVEFATDSPQGCTGAGGAPGEGVKVIVLSSPGEPQRVIVVDPPVSRYQLDLFLTGTRVLQLGNVANSQTNCFNRTYELKTVQGGSGYTVRSDPQGAAWIVVGTSSGFEATTTLYYTRVRVTFAPL